MSGECRHEDYLFIEPSTYVPELTYEWQIDKLVTGGSWTFTGSLNEEPLNAWSYGAYHARVRALSNCGYSLWSNLIQYGIEDCDTGDPGGRIASLAPNPAQNQVTVTVRNEIPIAQGGLDIRIKDMYGLEKIAVQSQTRETSLDISTLSVGIYIVYVQNGSKIEYLRLNVE